MNFSELLPSNVLHWNYRGFTEFPIHCLSGEGAAVTDIYLKENLISRIPPDIGKLEHLESLYLSGNDIAVLPREISKLRCLKCLDVSGNRIRYLPDEIGEVRSLKFLILDENELEALPLRIGELRSLRYLSVCDNKLQWLPQRPVYNYHHCEFRFWRNKGLKTIPYSLWYHMFRGQQTRSLNIGCLAIPKYQQASKSNLCRLKLKQDSREWEIDVDCPQQYSKLLQSAHCSSPSLYEICRRTLYQMIANTTDKLYAETYSIYSDVDVHQYENNNNNLMSNIEEKFKGFNFDNGNRICDLNGNNLNDNVDKPSSSIDSKKNKKKTHYVPADIVNDYFGFLPTFMKQELCNGPVSRCENISCKIPIFDYVLYEFTMGKIILIDNTEDVILSAAFCSKSCAEKWKTGKIVLSWTLVQESTMPSLGR